jgi:hypothetical protein
LKLYDKDQIDDFVEEKIELGLQAWVFGLGSKKLDKKCCQSMAA